MLEQLSDQIRECYERAAEARARADAINDPALKAEFLNTERRWLTLGRSYGFTKSLEDFTALNSERRRKFDERLANMRSAWAGLFPWKGAEQTSLVHYRKQ